MKYLLELLSAAGLLTSRRLTSTAGLLLAPIILLIAYSPAARAQSKPSSAPDGDAPQASTRPQTFTQEGLSVQFTITPITPTKGETASLMAGTEALVKFTVVDANVGQPVTSLHPTAWIDRRETPRPLDAKECREKVRSLLQPNLYKRPTLDLNSYFILALNNEPNISVIDPISGFGGSKLYTLVALASTGADWVVSPDKKRLYVSMPMAGQVAVIDTALWKVLSNIDSGPNPTRIALQHDGKYLWVVNEDGEQGAGGVTVIDTQTLKMAAQLKTGAGQHEIALSQDDSLAFVTNRNDGTLSVIDVRTLTGVTPLKIGGLPAAVAVSALSKAVYVADEREGAIVVIDGSGRNILARIKAEPGLCTVRIDPTGRFGFAVNRATNHVFIFDVSSNRLIHTVPVGLEPDQISFSDQFAYVRCRGSEYVTMIKLSDIDKEGEVGVTQFPAGQRAPRESKASAVADAVVRAPGEDSVVVANPADKTVYYYTEGMATPMGSFLNYGRDPKATLILDNSLGETGRGVYSTTIRLPDPGRYDVALLVDSPRLINCFDIAVAENPAQKTVSVVPIAIDPMITSRYIKAGESYTLQLKVTDTTSKLPRDDLKDIGVMVMLAPGLWQERYWTKARGGGIYEVTFTPPKPGIYYVYFQCPSLGVQLNYITPLTMRAY